jgi:hypothetical protein
MRDIFAIICRELAANIADEESTKEIVKTEIHNYESNLKESDRSPYLKCEKLYVHELEKWK